MNDVHPKFELLEATSGMHISLKPLPKPPKILSASRILRSVSVQDVHPIGVKWNLFSTSGLARQNSNPLPFFYRTRPTFSEFFGVIYNYLHVKDGLLKGFN
jgi:hypothetical protein